MRRVLVALLFGAMAATAVALWLTRPDEAGRKEFTLPAPRLTEARSFASASSEQAVVTSLSVVVNGSRPVPRLTRADVESIYLGRTTRWEDGVAVVPVMPAENSEAVREFLTVFLRKTPEQFRGYWRRAIISGAATAPVNIDSPLDLVDYVARTPGAIGLVEREPGDDRVAVVPVSGVTPGEDAAAPAAGPTDTMQTGEPPAETRTAGRAGTDPAGETISEPSAPGTAGTTATAASSTDSGGR